jgi:hypothetical protein
MEKRRFLVSLLLVFISFLALASAEISITQPETIYNNGDEFGINVSLMRTDQVNGFLEISIECESGIVGLYKSPVALKASQRKSVEIATILDKSVIGNNRGKCNVKGSYSDESIKSRDFTVSKDIDVSSSLIRNSFNPGEEVIFSGNAVKKNGKNLNGFLEVSIFETKNIISVKEGKFNSSIILPNNLAAGEQILIFYAYEKNSNGEIINEGTLRSSIKIAQVAKETKIALNKDKFIPGEELTYTLLVYDQSGQQMKVNSDLKIVDSKGKTVLTRTVTSGDANSFLTESNYTAGIWKIEGKFDSLLTKKEFNVESVEKISFEMFNSSLVVKNIGNVYYNKSVEIKIGEVSESKNINLNIGESKRFKLAAPDGNYQINVNGGSESRNLGSVFLTGKTVSIKEESKTKFITSAVTWVWAIILILLGLAIAFYYKKIAKSDFIGRKPDYLVMNELRNIEGRKNIDNGRKEKTSVVSLKIKELNEFMNDDSSAGEVIRKLLEEARGLKGKVVQSGESFNIIFAPIMTRETDNALRAVKIAKLIKEELDSHNRKYAQKAQYGIGIHEGEMIVELKNGDLNFNPLGNAISYAKKMAEVSEAEIYISNQIHSSTRSKVKVEKSKDGVYWKVNSIPDGDKHNKFIRNFMERQGRD